MKQLHVRFGLRLCENSEVKLSRRMFISNTLNKKRISLACAAGGACCPGCDPVENDLFPQNDCPLSSRPIKCRVFLPVSMPIVCATAARFGAGARPVHPILIGD